MRVAVISDIHGNRHALEAVLADAREAEVEETWCLGDIVGYGADPEACVALVRERCDRVLAGNHDLAVIGAIPTDLFSPTAAAAAHWTAAELSRSATAWLRSLSPFDVRGPVDLFHGSPRNPVWEYVLSDQAATAGMEAAPHRVSLIGHSHVALSFHQPPDRPLDGVPRPEGSQVQLGEGPWLLNPGATGQPRDGDPRAAWLLLDIDDGVAAWRRSVYDVAGAQASIRAAGLPDVLADRLAQGR